MITYANVWDSFHDGMLTKDYLERAQYYESRYLAGEDGIKPGQTDNQSQTDIK